MQSAGPEGPIEAGLDAIRAQFHVPGAFPDDVLAAADDAARRRPGRDHVDRTSWAFRTLDPAGSTDLDQAFFIDAAAGAQGGDLVLHYAIADVDFFVDPGGPIDHEAWARGETIYLPDRRSTLYPPALCEAAASLLPDGPRPAVVFTVRVAADGTVHLDGVERAVVHSRAKLAYDAIDAASIPGFAELSRRIVLAEDRRGAPRVEFPEQELTHTDQGWTLRFEARLESEDQNAGMSLATNLAVADALLAARTGLFRVMADVPDSALRRLRHTATAFHLDWPADMSLARFERSLPRDDPRAAAFLLAVRRSGGAASYQPYTDAARPWHAAIAATYVHATAPLRRLADRYVIAGALAVANGDALPEHVERAYHELPAVMAGADQLGHQVDKAVLDLAEAVLLSGREGEVFDGVIVDEDERGPLVQLSEPAVLARLPAHRVSPGDAVRARLVRADPASRSIELTRVG